MAVAAKRRTEERNRTNVNGFSRTRYIQSQMDSINILSKCKKCNIRDKTINHITSECKALAQWQYEKSNDRVAKASHWRVYEKYNLPEHQKEKAFMGL